MALIEYNGIILPYSDMTEFRMEAVYDPSNTDRILTKYVISAQTVINSDYIRLLDDSIPLNIEPAANVVATWQIVQQKLMAHRKRLSVKFNGVEMIPQRQEGVAGFVDAMNGPRPLKCEFIPMDGLTNQTFLVIFSIEANYWINQSTDELERVTNPNKNLPGNVVLYNRWTESVQIDEENRTVKKRTGKLMIRSDNVKGWIPDFVRASMAVVGLPPGNFLRHRSEYTVSEDGLGLSYDITDREVFRLPPPPAFKAEAEYAEQGTKGDGKRFLSFRIKLWGDNNTSQVDLIKTCAAIAFFKIESRGGNLFGAKEDAGITVGSNLRVGGYENWAEFRIVALKPAIPNVIKGKVGGIGNVGNVAVAGAAEGFAIGGAFGAITGAAGRLLFGGFGGGAQGGGGGGAVAAPANKGAMAPSQSAAFMPDPGIQPKYLIRGTAGLLLQAAAYYDPSLQNVQLGQAGQTAGNAPVGLFNGVGQLNQGKLPGQAGKNPEA